MDVEDSESDPDHYQNLIISSFYLFRHILKISSKAVHKFLSYLVHKQTNGETTGQTNPGENITSLAEVIRNQMIGLSDYISDKNTFKVTQIIVFH